MRTRTTIALDILETPDGFSVEASRDGTKERWLLERASTVRDIAEIIDVCTYLVVHVLADRPIVVKT